MPVVGIPADRLAHLVGGELTQQQLLEELRHIGCDIEDVGVLRRYRCSRCGALTEVTQTEESPAACEQCGTDFREHPELCEESGEVNVIRMELLAVRPDMFDVGGLARALRGYLGREVGLPTYELAEPGATDSVAVDPQLSDPATYRPFIACATVRGIALDDDRVRIIMKLQENLHWALGRNRKNASIGVYDLDTVEGPFSYRAVGRDQIRFTPLGGPLPDIGTATPDQILTHHPKGRAFAHLLEGWPAVPLLEDSRGQVLSMPPIINSEETRVTRQSHNLFIDVTGTTTRVVTRALNIITSSIQEVAPEATIGRVVIGDAPTPDYSPQVMAFHPDDARRILGLPLQPKQMVELLRRMRHDAVLEEDGTLTVHIPAYRNDVLHERDLHEDVAIAYGYHNIVPSLTRSQTVGTPHPRETATELLRQILCGLGYTEVMTLILTSPERAFDALSLDLPDNVVQIRNPVSVDQSIVRTTLMPGLLDTFARNIGGTLPQHIFEVGEGSQLDERAETGARDVLKMACGVIGPKVGFADIKQVAESVLRELGTRLEVTEANHPTFIAGRAAAIAAQVAETRLQLGVMGEVHPQVLERFALVYPTVLMEIDLEPFVPTV